MGAPEVSSLSTPRGSFSRRILRTQWQLVNRQWDAEGAQRGDPMCPTMMLLTFVNHAFRRRRGTVVRAVAERRARPGTDLVRAGEWTALMFLILYGAL